jgi:hypothetical protein
MANFIGCGFSLGSRRLASWQLDAERDACIQHGMKKIIIVVLLITLGTYIYLPYLAVGKYRDAINTGDTATVNTMVDYKEFRKSLRGQLVAKTAPENPVAAVASILGSSVIDKALTEFVTEEYIGKLLAIGKVINSGEAQRIESTHWAGLRTLEVKMTGDPSTLTFRLTGSGWKLVGKEVSATIGKLQTMLGL